MILFSAAPPSPSPTYPSFSEPTLRPCEAPSSIVHLHAHNSQCTFRHGVLQVPESQKSPDSPPTDLRADWHSCPNPPSPRVLSGNGTHPVMWNQGAVGTPHPLVPGFPSRLPSLQTLPLKDTRDHSLGPSAVASILAPCLQRSTPC